MPRFDHLPDRERNAKKGGELVTALVVTLPDER
jgi:hypothetical protein